MGLLKWSFLVALAMGCSAVAVAQESSTPLNQTAPERSRFRLSYFADVDGPSISNPESPFKNNEEGLQDKSARTGWYHEPGIGYRLQEGVTVTLKAPFTHYSTPSATGSSFETDDLSLGISNSGLVRTENFNLYASVSFSPSMTEYSRSRQRTGEFGSTLIPSYKFGTSRFKLEWVSLLKQYFYQPTEELNAKTKSNIARGTLSNFKVEFYPALLYSITEDLSAVLGGHLLFMNSRGQGVNFTQLEDTLNLGAHYKFNRNLSIRPELRLTDPNNISARNTEAGMLIFGSL